MEYQFEQAQSLVVLGAKVVDLELCRDALRAAYGEIDALTNEANELRNQRDEAVQLTSQAVDKIAVLEQRITEHEQKHAHLVEQLGDPHVDPVDNHNPALEGLDDKPKTKRARKGTDK